ncbi:hypothetical protein Rhow_005166 [Rhodococcus wratislaviensis]|uniref:Uncharacterized protein n=1 Tax=Rhodococcus wratislaviensis TaxID=44752 RepID=A0A402CD35_RHOWR|nr:hypothetical protein Rhow_005166 [Rhodococcus wratislaviensis]
MPGLRSLVAELVTRIVTVAEAQNANTGAGARRHRHLTTNV